jgi:hypothetical protein
MHCKRTPRTSLKVTILSLILGLIGVSGLANAEEAATLADSVTYENALPEIGLKWKPEGNSNVINYARKVAQPKSPLIALSYAILPGYFIPAAFGHAYAGAKMQAAVISSARLSGRIMWMYSFFDNLMVDNAEGSISGPAMTMFYAGLALDLGGYLYDIIHAPVEVAKYNQRFYTSQTKKVTPFLDYAEDGPYCGLAYNF